MNLIIIYIVIFNTEGGIFMKCPYCNKELGEKNQCITSDCYAFGKVFPKNDSEKDKEEINIDKSTPNSDIDSKLEEIEQNAKHNSEDDSVGSTSNVGLYLLIAILILFVIGFNLI